MSADNNRSQHYKTIAKTCFTANTIYLILHAFYLVLFIISQLTVLIIVDAVVIGLYLLCYLLLNKRKYYLYALICGNTFFAFISVTTVMLGFSTGFHFYLIGLCVVSFFTSYFSKNKSVKGSIIWVGLSLAIYLTLYLVTEFNPPYYAIDKWLEVTLFITHSIVIFGFIASYLVVFIKYALTLENKIMNESRTDELTQISNRYGLFDYFDQEEDKSSLVLALFDIDDFKNINDIHGHATGDAVLKQVADMISETLHDCFVCRYGGEEFVVVLKDAKEKPYFDQLEDLRKQIEKQTFEFENVKINLTITIGAAKYQKDITLENWIEIADQKMYSGKNTGKNKTVI